VNHATTVFDRAGIPVPITSAWASPSATHHRRWLLEPNELLETLPLIDVPTLACRLGVGERFVRRLVAERGIEVIKIGRHVRFDPEVVEAWIEDRRQAPKRWAESYYLRIERERRRLTERAAEMSEPTPAIRSGSQQPKAQTDCSGSTRPVEVVPTSSSN
jgi:excisionase family DNA binding protein